MRERLRGFRKKIPDRNVYDDHPEGIGEIPDEDMFGYLEEPMPFKYSSDAENILSDPDELEKHPRLKVRVDSLVEGGKVAWGYGAAHKGIVLTTVSAAVAASGAVGIGFLVKRKK